MKETLYHTNWQKNRINFVLSKYEPSFFVGKKNLELAPYNGYIGAYFEKLGADVTAYEGRIENVENIKRDYPEIKIYQKNLDTPEWDMGYFDIIINFGLFYHLENYHEQHLTNCINNCNLMFFETVIFDSFDTMIHFRNESGDDQSLGLTGGTPTTSFVEDIFKKNGVNFIKYSDSVLNGDYHHYDWADKNSQILDQYARRFWVVTK